MRVLSWRQLPLLERIRLLRYMLPPFLAVVVVVYQLQVARTLAEVYGHAVHYSVEIAFYSLVGPMVTLITLRWVEHELGEKEILERQVRARTRQLASLTAASADAILSLDAQGHITSWNRGAQRLFGYTPQAIIGHPLEMLLPDAPALAEKLQREGVVQDFETRALTRDGQTITVNLTQTLLSEEGEAASISLLIMRDVTVRSERAAIIEEERARISRDLHDGLAQTLYFLALKADMARQLIREAPDQTRDTLKEIGQEARRAIRDVRRAIFALQPLDWSQGDFFSALRHFAEDFAAQIGWQLEIHLHPDDLSIPPRLEPTVFRVVQESLNNIAKHASASTVQITIARDPAAMKYQVTIRDDGRGFDTKSARRGLGLPQMQRRVQGLGGTLLVHSHPGGGTTIQVELPLSEGEKMH